MPVQLCPRSRSSDTAASTIFYSAAAEQFGVIKHDLTCSSPAWHSWLYATRDADGAERATTTAAGAALALVHIVQSIESAAE